jgi:hypothetical protein
VFLMFDRFQLVTFLSRVVCLSTKVSLVRSFFGKEISCCRFGEKLVVYVIFGRVGVVVTVVREM